MIALIELLHIGSPVVRVMLGLLPHLPAPVIFKPARSSKVPAGCVQVPTANLIIAGAAGPIGHALLNADAIAREARCDLILVSLREPGHPHAIRFDAILHLDDRTEHASDLLLWRCRNRAAALVPVARHGQSIVMGLSGLIPSDPTPYANPVERLQGLAMASAELRRTLWDEQ
jgi:hypothetical protein